MEWPGMPPASGKCHWILCSSKIQVQSWTEELHCRVNCFLKAACAGGCLVAMDFEESVFNYSGRVDRTK
eukprot:5683361-Lingulodinium_polyedra.AAC.1